MNFKRTTTSPSDLDKRITLQTVTKVPDGMGNFDDTFIDIDTVWAKKTTHRSDEAVQDMKETGTLTHNWRLRYRKDVRASWRINFGNKYMAIIGPPIEVNEGGGRHWLDITAKESA